MKEDVKIKCICCGLEKDLDSFKYAKNRKFNRLPYCIDCTEQVKINRIKEKSDYDKLRLEKLKSPEFDEKRREIAKISYYNKKLEYPEEYKKYLLEKKLFRANNKEKYIYWRTKRRSEKEGHPFNLDLEDIIIPKYCPILGIELDRYEGFDNFNVPSIDKIIPELGYIKGNIRIISKKANMMKLNANFEELKIFSKNILKYIEEYEQNNKKE